MQGFETHRHPGRNVAAEVFAGGTHAVDGDGRPQVDDEQFAALGDVPCADGGGQPVGSEGLGRGISVDERYGGAGDEAHEVADVAADILFGLFVGVPGGGEDGAVDGRVGAQHLAQGGAAEFRGDLLEHDLGALHHGGFGESISYVYD